MALKRRQLLLILLLRRRFRTTNVKRKRFWIQKIYSERITYRVIMKFCTSKLFPDDSCFKSNHT